MRILIAEDDPILADGLAASLRDSGHSVDCVATGARPTARSRVRVRPADSRSRPAQDERPRRAAAPARTEPRPAGADSHRAGRRRRPRARPRPRRGRLPREAVCAWRSSRRACARSTRRGPAGKPTPVEFGGLTYDQAGRVARVGGEVLDLSARELVLLELLLLRVDRTVARRSSSTTCANGARRSAPTRSKSTCTGCAESSNRRAWRS